MKTITTPSAKPTMYIREDDIETGFAAPNVLPFWNGEPLQDRRKCVPGTIEYGNLYNGLTDAVANAQSSGIAGALVVVRIAEFSTLVEGFGYRVGQRLSELFQKRLRQALRDTDLVDPLSGDEFALLLQGVGGQDQMARMLDRLIRQITGMYSLKGVRYHISASAGVALFPTHTANPDDLLRYARTTERRADPYASPGYQIFTHDILKFDQNRLSITAEVSRALADNALALHYQPQYDLSNGRIVAAEALLRYRNEQGQLVFPERFIEIIEDTDLIVPIGHWVIREACSQLRQWREAGHLLRRITVNLAPRQLMDAQLLEVIHDAIGRAGLDFQDLEVEIAERQVMKHLPLATRILEELSALGVRVTLDDFGSGHSSLSYLAQLPLKMLKIDRAFLRNFQQHEKTARIVAAVIAVAQELGLETVAEGIEQKQQETDLLKLGCQYGQGFAFSKPVAAEHYGMLFDSPSAGSA